MKWPAFFFCPLLCFVLHVYRYRHLSHFGYLYGHVLSRVMLSLEVFEWWPKISFADFH